MIGLSAFFYLAGAQLAPTDALNAALNDAEPPPSMRAAFRATISGEGAERRIQYDPLQPPGKRFRLLARIGENEELDKIVDDWAQERQPDVRLFADDLRASLGRGRMTQQEDGGWAVMFEHRLSDNDGPVDAMLSQRMSGSLSLNPATGTISKLEYSINAPFKTEDGSLVDEYRQVYSFGRSKQWGVTFVTGYDLYASGGRFGLRDSRQFNVKVTDVAFTLAGDSQQILVSKNAPEHRPENQQADVWARADLN